MAILRHFQVPDFPALEDTRGVLGPPSYDTNPSRFNAFKNVHADATGTESIDLISYKC